MNWTHRRAFRFATFTLFAATLAAAPATQAVRSTDDIERIYRNTVVGLKNVYQAKLQAAEKQRLDGYRALLQRAIEKKDSMVAAHFRKQIEQLEAEPNRLSPPEVSAGETEKPSLDKVLKDETWEWSEDDSIKFKADGTVENRGWTARGLETTWKVIDSHTVLLHIERGRAHNLYAILIFGPDFGSYTGYGFEGGNMSKHVQLKR